MIIHRPIPEEVSVKAFKKVLEGPSQREREEEDAKKKKLQVKVNLFNWEPLHKKLSKNYYNLLGRKRCSFCDYRS